MGAEIFSARPTRRGFCKIAVGAAAATATALWAPQLLHADGGNKDLEPRTLESTFLMYHQMSASSLKRDLLNYINRGFEPIGLERLVDHLNGNVMISSDQPTFMVTCDDGLASQYPAVTEAVYEVLNETGYFVPVVFFIMTKFNDPPEGVSIADLPEDTPTYNDHSNIYMPKWKVVDLIKRGFRVENHTVNHDPNFSNLPSNIRDGEVLVGEQRIQQLWKIAGVEKKSSAFAFPRGLYYGQEEFIQNYYDLAFSTISTTFHSSSMKYRLGRIGMA